MNHKFAISSFAASPKMMMVPSCVSIFLGSDAQRLPVRTLTVLANHY